MVRFASGSKSFLSSLSEKLSLAAGLNGGSLCKNKGGFHLIYAKKDSGKLYDFMYNRVPSNLYLGRKYNKFQKAFELSGVVA